MRPSRGLDTADQKYNLISCMHGKWVCYFFGLVPFEVQSAHYTPSSSLCNPKILFENTPIAHAACIGTTALLYNIIITMYICRRGRAVIVELRTAVIIPRKYLFHPVRIISRQWRPTKIEFSTVH